ncbi:hypothetical protein C8J57DRAFT_1271884 [Mycena rebaudengoi]|nr:hypothetical protein C8J57DRAFT_1271884 [Mycena rebaudengoi]
MILKTLKRLKRTSLTESGPTSSSPLKFIGSGLKMQSWTLSKLLSSALRQVYAHNARSFLVLAPGCLARLAALLISSCVLCCSACCRFPNVSLNTARQASPGNTRAYPAAALGAPRSHVSRQRCSPAAHLPDFATPARHTTFIPPVRAPKLTPLVNPAQFALYRLVLLLFQWRITPLVHKRADDKDEEDAAK